MQHTKQKIKLAPLIHKGNTWIGIQFPHLPVLQQAVRKTSHIQWSQSNKCWYLPFTRFSYTELLKNIEPFADIDNSALKQYKVSGTSALNQPQTVLHFQASANIKTAGFIHAVNSHVLPAMQQTLILKAYSPSTIKTYLAEMSQFLQMLRNVCADALPVTRIKNYLQYCFEKLKLSENTLHSRINALKFYYEQVLKKEKFFWEIPRPKKKQPLPKHFNQDEIAAIINSITNKKHKTMLMLAYGAGLRVSEVTSLKTHNMDSKRMTILLVEYGKGKKDRMLPLSPVLLVMLRVYALGYKPEKKGYLFTGANKQSPYSVRSLQEVLQAAKAKAGIMKPGGIHSLRHSFATHLIEKGTDVTMIQKLLGHGNIKTTLIYLHTSNRDLLSVISPLDALQLK